MSKIANLANPKISRLVLAVGSVLLVVANLFFSIQGGAKKLSATKCSTLLDKTYEGISGFGINQDEVDYIIAQGGAPTNGDCYKKT